MYSLRLKRCLDLGITGPLFLLSLPIYAAVVALVWLDVGSPIVFRQRRPGLNAKPFDLYKFRTMTEERGPAGKLLPDEQRLTRLGKILRWTSLDELPQLINVFKGDMSLVGPRPLLMRYIDRYTERQKCRHEVLPGITGWGQINGRNALSWEDKFEMDVWYVQNQSLALDLRILLMTVSRILLGKGIRQPGHATAEEFSGNDSPEP